VLVARESADAANGAPMREHFDRAVEFAIIQDLEPPPPGLTREARVARYYSDLWLVCRCDELPAQVAVVLFDEAVNHGPVEAVKLLQAEVRAHQDGVVGRTTLAAVKSRNQDDLACCYAARRAVRYAGMKQNEQATFRSMLRLFDSYRLAVVIG
jgi:hypothetical protein